jgi:ABC-type multidrug transport system ATPase subunit
LAHDEGKSILVIIHDVSEIDMFDQIIMMTKLDNVGRLAFSGTPEEARAYFGTELKEAYGLLAENPAAYVKGERQQDE